jgi:adenine-specific DNA-methyltransferase
VYVKHVDSFKTVKSTFKLKVQSNHFSNPDNDPRGAWVADPFDSPGIRSNLTYEIINPNTGAKYMPPKGRCWRTGPLEYQKLLSEKRIVFGKTGKSKPQLKRFLSDADEKGQTPTSVWDDVGTATHATKELQEIFGEKQFETPKPVSFLQKIFELSTRADSLILDSFAGSGTTAHAILNLNKEDGGNRKFILIEMEDYAERITAERVKRVIAGYAGNEGTNGSFDFYELGKPLFVGENNEYLNEEIEIEKIREYIWYSETRTAYEKPDPKKDSHYFLGKQDNTSYYFIYEKKELTTLDYDSLASIKTKSRQYIIYADNCLLPKDFMLKNNIVFKKIPRDISRF